MDLSFLQIPPFTITINHRGKAYNLTVNQVRIDCSMEVFEVKGLHTAKRIQTMRPYFRTHEGKTDKYNVHVYPGTEVKDKKALELVIAEIRQAISCWESLQSKSG